MNVVSFGCEFVETLVQNEFVLMLVGRTLIVWHYGLLNGLFLPIRAGTRACVSAVLLEGLFGMCLGRSHSRTHRRVPGRVAKSVSTSSLTHGRVAWMCDLSQ